MKLSEVKTEADARRFLVDMCNTGRGMAIVEQLRTADALAGEVLSITVTDKAINAVAEVMWNDRDARLGGVWADRNPNEVVVVQTKATAKAALEAALRVL